MTLNPEILIFGGASILFLAITGPIVAYKIGEYTINYIGQEVAEIERKAASILHGIKHHFRG